MVNYKGKKRTITVYGVEFQIPVAATIIRLNEDTGSATTADAMFDVNDQLVYQVASGKTFHLLGVKIYHDETTTGGSVAISSGDTEDAETAAIITVNTGVTVNVIMEYPMDKTFASGKFITINPSAAVVENITMIGYEI